MIEKARGVVGIVEYGCGNTGSIHNMLHYLDIPSVPVRVREDLASVDRLILPGVGAFDHGIAQLSATGADALVHDAAASGMPILGICLGMQLLTEGSEEGVEPGLGLVPGHCELLRPSEAAAKVPHMGWNTVRTQASNPLLERGGIGDRFYFVHSYHVVVDNSMHALGVTEHGGQVFNSMISRNAQIFGAQFHPEKSHVFGMGVLKKFSCVPVC